ncbi:hypothetical protein Sjap_017234 [Stephania japonica]|uniref:TF-B3 domain-containing protein n=1 Tax=Stephania japonica TaxID=461633 RepID=A0AAP0I5T2_9MAGN
MVKAKTSYEEFRTHRLEENKKRMEDLNLTQLAKSILSASPKRSGTSPRAIDLPSTDIVPNLTNLHLLGVGFYLKKPRYSKRGQFNGVYASDEARQIAIDRAEELQSSLGDELPSFVKPMVRSHVTGCFWLGLPAKFCKDYMPKDTETVMLVDENGDEYPTIFISRRTGLSGEWKAFSLAHDLADGDALIFQLVEPTTLKGEQLDFFICVQVWDQNTGSTLRPIALGLLRQRKEEDTHEIKICGNPMTVESKIPHEEMDELAAVENDINDLR